MIAEDAKQATKQTAKSPPSRVLWFEGLLYGSVFLYAVRVGIDGSDGMDPVTFSALYVLLIGQLLLIWLAARRRKNWARWLLLSLFLVLAVTSLLQDGLGSPGWKAQSIPSQALKIAWLLLQDIGLILAFTGSARRWFNPNAPRHRHRIF